MSGTCLPRRNQTDLYAGPPQIQVIPVHGEFKHRKAQAGLAADLGIPKENIFMINSGMCWSWAVKMPRLQEKVPVGTILVDGLGVGDVGNVVLRDRQHLAEDGIMIVVLGLDSGSGQLVSGPDLVSRGFVYVKESDALMDEARILMTDVLDNCIGRGCKDWGKIKSAVKIPGRFLSGKTKRRPMILPIIMEV